MILKADRDGKVRKIPSSSIHKVVNGHRCMTIVGGEFAIVPDTTRIAISTLLGSCVAIMLYDRHTRMRAMNHFLLPASKNNTECYRYGLYSVESMINEMLKMGCKKGDLVAKIVGGASVIASDSDIGAKNVSFAREFCAKEGIAIISEHVFGNRGRVVLYLNGFETLIRHIDNELVAKVRTSDQEYSSYINKKKEAQAADITLF